MTATKPRKPRTLDEITKEVVMETIEKKKSRTKLEQMAAEYAEREVPASDDPDGWTDYKFYREVVTRHYLAGFKAAREMAVGLRNGEETVTVSDNTVREKGEEKCIIEMEEKRRMATRL